MKTLQSYVLGTRFMCTVGHLLVLLMLTLSYKSNVEMSLSDSASSADRKDEEVKSLALICFGLFCILWDMIGTVCGISIFMTYVNITQICFHFVGGVLLSRYIAEDWNSRALLPLILMCSIPTALVEIFILCARNVVL